MAAVAIETGMARQTLYSFVAGRRELIELVLTQRSRELMNATRSVAAIDHLEPLDGLVEFMAVMVELTRDDHEFGELSDALTRHEAFPFLTGPSPLRSVMREGLDPPLDQAEAHGLLRTDRSRDELVAWVQTVLGPLAARNDLDRDSLREVLRTFVLPALVSPREL